MSWKVTPNHGVCTKDSYYDFGKGCFVCCDEDLPIHVYIPNAHTPDRFVKYGLVLFTKEVEPTIKFIELYKPYLN